MSLTVYVRDAGRDIGGAEFSWTRAGYLVGENSHEYPLLSRIDPFGDLDLGSADVSALAVEIKHFKTSQSSVPDEIDRLLELCEQVGSLNSGSLAFVGD